jgi:hypothetical protein
VGATAKDHPPAAEGAAIPGHGGQAGERDNATPIEVAEFRQIRDERARGDRSYTGDGAQQVIGFPPYRG